MPLLHPNVTILAKKNIQKALLYIISRNFINVCFLDDFTGYNFSVFLAYKGKQIKLLCAVCLSLCLVLSCEVYYYAHKISEFDLLSLKNFHV